MEGCAIGVCANAASEAAKGIFQEIKRHIRYIFIYKKNVDKFEKKLEELNTKRISVQLEVNAAETKGEKRKPDVELWCKRVDKVMHEDVKKMKDLEDKAKNNFKSRYQLSKKAEEGVAAVDDLIQQYCQFNGVGYPDVQPPKCEPLKNFKAFDSRKEVFDGVIEALKDSTITMIGVYGTGGVGKTTLVNQVATQVQKDKLFDWVVKATVTQTPNIYNIQGEIAESLRLELKEMTTTARARSLLRRFRKEKRIPEIEKSLKKEERTPEIAEPLQKEERILIILDDIWARLDLEEVGIPFGDQYDGCKILLTSRNGRVLTDEMGVKSAFAIDVLNETEAWNLFKETAENDFKDSDLRSVATEVAKKCEGLPVAIVKVARALSTKAIHAWKDASLKFQRPSPSNFTGIPGAVYSAIQLSYDNLGSEELKQTFLLCGLLGHNARVQDLVRYGMGFP